MTEQDISEAIDHTMLLRDFEQNPIKDSMFTDIMDALLILLSFTQKHLIRNGRLTSPGWRIWLYPMMIAMVLRVARIVVQAIKKKRVPDYINRVNKFYSGKLLNEG